MATKTFNNKHVVAPKAKIAAKSAKLASGRYKLVGTDVATELSDLVTVITNISGSTLTFGFIPPHGKRLANNASVTIKGDLKDQLQTGGGRQNKRKADALQNAIDLKLIRYTVDRRHIVYAAVDSAVAIAAGDLVYLAAGKILPASSFTWDTNIATTQAAFANSFMGVALDTHVLNSGAVTNFRVDISPLSTYSYTCTSETHEVGDTFGPAKNPDSNTMLNQKLVKAAASSSIARGVKRDASAATTAIVRVQSAYWGSNAAGAQ